MDIEELWSLRPRGGMPERPLQSPNGLLEGCLLASTVHQVLASNSGLSLLLSASDTYVPEPENVQRVHTSA